LIRVEDEDDPAEGRPGRPEGLDGEDPRHRPSLHVAARGAEDAVPVEPERSFRGRPVGEDGVGVADHQCRPGAPTLLLRQDEGPERTARPVDRMSLDGPAVGAQPVGAAFDDPIDALDRTGPTVHGDELTQAFDERLLAALQIGRQPSYAVFEAGPPRSSSTTMGSS